MQIEEYVVIYRELNCLYKEVLVVDVYPWAFGKPGALEPA
jgi:hypothetical protein